MHNECRPIKLFPVHWTDFPADLRHKLMHSHLCVHSKLEVERGGSLQMEKVVINIMLANYCKFNFILGKTEQVHSEDAGGPKCVN